MFSLVSSYANEYSDEYYTFMTEDAAMSAAEAMAEGFVNHRSDEYPVMVFDRNSKRIIKEWHWRF